MNFSAIVPKVLNSLQKSESTFGEQLPRSPFNLQSGVLLLALVLLGYLGNYFNLSLFLGVNFLFGSIATLTIVYLFGLIPGILATIVASTHTIVLWSHPYAVVIFTLEALWVGWQLHHRRSNLVIADCLYWLLVGIPLVWFFYHQVMDLPIASTGLIMIKQAVNGIFNALIANLLITHTPIYKWLGRLQYQQTVSFQQTLLNLFVAFVFFPSLSLTVLSSHDALRDIEQELPERLQSTSAYLLTNLESWKAQQQTTLKALGAIAIPSLRNTDSAPTASNPSNRRSINQMEQDSQPAALSDASFNVSLTQLQQQLQFIQDTLPHSVRTYVMDFEGAVSASYPNDPILAPRLGIRPNPSTPDTLEISIQDLSGQDPVILYRLPIFEGDRLLGYAIHEVQSRFLNQLIFLGNDHTKNDLQVTLLDEQQRVLASTRQDLDWLQIFDHSQSEVMRVLADNIYHWLPNTENTPLFVRWKQSYYAQATPLALTSWTLLVEAPANPHFELLQTYYIQRLGLSLIIVVIAILVAYFLSQSLVNPVTRLAMVTTNLPDRLLEQENIAWPQTSIAEMKALVSNFNVMARSLEQQFQAIHLANETLEQRIADRTQELSTANQDLKTEILERQRMTEMVRQSEAELRQKAIALETALNELHRTQTQLIQSEKMSSLGQLVAGVAHEINNPVNFIHGNLSHIEDYSQDLLNLINLYQNHYPNPDQAIQQECETIDLEFLQTDLPKILQSLQVGTERIRTIVLSLRNFSRTDESEFKAVDIHAGIDSTLLILQYRLKARAAYPGISISKQYGTLPLVECYPSQLNQVFMNILANAIDALEDYQTHLSTNRAENTSIDANQITIQTAVVDENWVTIAIADNGPGIPDHLQKRIFEPFFTTKPIGKGTGMGMSISYQIVVEQHGGQISCQSTPAQGTTFLIKIPIHQSSHPQES